MSLKSDLIKLLDNSIRLCNGASDTQALENILNEMRERINQPLRIAVSGIMKAGKSTFLNALMGAKLVYTGTKETTYTVCWFKYAENPYITIVFRNGERETAAFEDLEKWSVRAFTEENPRIDEVKYLIIHYPNEILKQLEFIDTPGLNSAYVTDAKNTMDFLAVRGSKETIEETSMADAIVYAFNRSAGEFDEKLLNSFNGNSGNSSPINSMGILTRVDDVGIWNIDSGASPTQTAEPIVSSVMKKNSMKRVLFAVFPVCAKQVEGFSELTEADWATLKELSELAEDELSDLVFDAADYEIQNYIVDKRGNRRELKKLRRTARKSDLLNMTITAAEGVGLGALGIGLPDIVVFIGMILKGIYEVSLKYGYDYNSAQEKYFMLAMMKTALAKGEEWDFFNKEVDNMILSSFVVSEEVLKIEIEETSKAFATEMLVLKFIQGIPVVGVVGGAFNPIYYNKIMNYVGLKYYKRYLTDKLKAL